MGLHIGPGSRRKMTLFALFFLFISSGAYSQSSDYLKIRNSLVMFGCGQVDTQMVGMTLRNLLALDTTAIHENLHLYYEDLAMSYWSLQGSIGQDIALTSCIAAHRKALHHKPDYFGSLWGIAFAYIFHGDCDRGLYYLGVAKTKCKRKHWDAEQEKAILKKCSTYR